MCHAEAGARGARVHRIGSVVHAMLFVLLFVVACGGDGPSGPGNGGGLPNGSMSAVIDGVPWTANFAVAGANDGNGGIGIAGTSTNGISISLGLVANGPGTYVIAPGQNVNGGVIEGALVWQALFGSGSGSITLTSLSAAGAAGTFTFTALPTAGSGAVGNKVVTQGQFNVTF